MTHYEDVLAELREKGSILANQYIVELYNILRYEENLPPEDCRAMIEHDCIDLWSKATIRKYLPPEAKDAKKQKAGKIGAENKTNKNKEAALLITNTIGGARTNLAENDSISQNEQESMTFHKEIDHELSTRTLSPELIEAHKINEEKERKIEELEEENRLLTCQRECTSIEGGFKVYRARVDYVSMKAQEIKEKNEKSDYLYIIARESDVWSIVEHMPMSDQEIEELAS